MNLLKMKLHEYQKYEIAEYHLEKEIFQMESILQVDYTKWSMLSEKMYG